MADYENRWRRDQSYVHDSGEDRGRWRGDVDRNLLETSRRLEQRHDYSPDLIADLRYFAGAESDRDDYSSRHHARRYGSARADTRRDYSCDDYGRHDDERHGRGFFERAGDEMASWVGSDDAERRRRMDAQRGDQGAQHHKGLHHRGRGPRGYTRSDERIREDVSDRLTDDPYVDASDIEVSVSGCEVTLTGTVDDRRAKRRAEDVAESVSGVVYVQNNLRVRQHGHGGTGTAAGASAIAGLGGEAYGGDPYRGDPYRRRF